jgi:AraC-like DNA-binding protein
MIDHIHGLSKNWRAQVTSALRISPSSAASRPGCRPRGLLIRLRLQTAMELLQRGTHNVSEAAAAVGYEAPFYFPRLFRKHMGIAPSTCRIGP